MKTTYTAPSISSVSDNEITDIASVELYLPHLRLIQLKGVPVRITINKDKYIELNSVEEEIDISNYYECLKNVMQFFYGTAHLYACVDNGKLSIYDIFTNDNYLSTMDMNYLEQTYHIPIVKPIAEGTFTFNYLIEILDKKRREGIDPCSLHIFPCMYLDDDRGSGYTTPKIITKIIVGEKPVYKPATYNTASTQKPATQTAKTTTTSPVQELGTLLPAVEQPEVFKLTTKQERISIYKEVVKNVVNYVNKNTFTETQMSWFKQNGVKFAHAFAIHTLPKTRHIVYNYCKQFGDIVSYYGRTNTEKWAELFLYFFQDEYSDSIMKNHDFSADIFEADKFAAIFKEELEEFDKFYVAETDAKEDWRYGGDYNV